MRKASVRERAELMGLSKKDLVNLILSSRRDDHKFMDTQWHIIEIYKKIISHKKAIITCEFRPTIEGLGQNKTLTEKKEFTDKLSINSLKFFVSSMPWHDPEFQASEERFYHVEFPKQVEEHIQEVIEYKIKEFKKKNKKVPNKKEREKIIHEVKSNDLHGVPCIEPGLVPKFETLKVKVYGKKEKTEYASYFEFLDNVDVCTPICRCKDQVLRYQDISLDKWNSI